MLASAKPGIPSKGDNDGSQIGNTLDRHLVMASSLSVPVVKNVTGEENVSCQTSKLVVSPFCLHSFPNILC